MRTLSSKTLLAALNPSPVFEAVAIFAERLALNGDESRPNEICMADNFAVLERTNDCRRVPKTQLPLPGVA